MNPFAAIDNLSDLEIDGITGQNVSIIAAEMLFVNQEVQHLAHCNLGGFFQICVKAHGDVLRWGLGARPAELHVLANDQLKRSPQRCLDRDVRFQLQLFLSGVGYIANVSTITPTVPYS